MRLRHGLGVSVVLMSLAFAGDAPPREPNWSNPATDTSPENNVTFHGPFFNEPVFWNYDGLPEHAFVRLEFDLLILRSWDGSVQYVNGRKDAGGPDYIRCSIPGGPILLSTTFSNLPPDDPGFKDNGKTQNYPSPVPGDLLRPQTGSVANSSMGYHYPKPGPPQLVPMDATYHISLLLPHHDAKLAVRLEAMGLSDLLDESWGVKDVKVTPLTAEQSPPPDEAAIATAFATAIDATATAQPDAVNTLIAGMDQTVAWINQNVQPRGLDANAVTSAINDLAGDDNHMSEREAATPTLFNFGPTVEPYLRDARNKLHGEQAMRIEQLLSRLGVTPIEDDNLRRVALATRVLEVIGTPAAMDARKKLVQTP